MNSLLFLVLLALPFIYCQTQQQVLSECVDTLYGSLCLDITSQECFELTGTISVGGQTIYGPTSVPIATILSQIQNQKDDPNSGNLMCFPLTESSIYGSCQLCATVDDLNIDGDTIHYCGVGTFNCTSMIGPSIQQEFDIPCFNLEHCGLFNCRNECNERGVCTSLGLCECYKGYYGYDCSIHITQNCLISIFDTTCWELYSTECDVVNLQVYSLTGYTFYSESTVDQLKNFSIIPPTTVIDEPNLKCDLSLSMDNIHPEDTNIIGCPTILMQCNSIAASHQKIDCLTIGSTPYESLCPPTETHNNPTNNADDPQPTSSNNTFYPLVAGLLTLFVLLSLGFMVMNKFGGFKRICKETQQPQPVYLPEDEEPLHETE